MIGAYRSHCTAVIYDHLKDRELPIITFASTSSVLSKKSLYRNLFRTSPSDTLQAEAIADLIEHFKWSKVHITLYYINKSEENCKELY